MDSTQTLHTRCMALSNVVGMWYFLALYVLDGGLIILIPFLCAETFSMICLHIAVSVRIETLSICH